MGVFELLGAVHRVCLGISIMLLCEKHLGAAHNVCMPHPKLFELEILRVTDSTIFLTKQPEAFSCVCLRVRVLVRVSCAVPLCNRVCCLSFIAYVLLELIL